MIDFTERIVFLLLLLQPRLARLDEAMRVVIEIPVFQGLLVTCYGEIKRVTFSVEAFKFLIPICLDSFSL